MKPGALSKWLLIALLVLIIIWSFSSSVDGFQVNRDLNEPGELAGNLIHSLFLNPPPAWATEADIARVISIGRNFSTYINSNVGPNMSRDDVYNLIIPALKNTLGPIYTASKEAGDSDSVTFDKIASAHETFNANLVADGPINNIATEAPVVPSSESVAVTANQLGPTGTAPMSVMPINLGPTGTAPMYATPLVAPPPMSFAGNMGRMSENFSRFFSTLPNDTNTNEHKLLLMSVVSTPPPSWATAKQIADTNKQITNFIGTSVASANKARTIFNNALSKAYTESKAAGDTDSVTLDKLIAAMRATLISGEVASADVYEPPPVNPSWAANKNPLSLIDLPNWVITGTHDPSWMSPTQIAQLSTLQVQADNIKNMPEKLGLLFGFIRITYIYNKSINQSDSYCLDRIISSSNLAINNSHAYVIPATEPTTIKTWPSFTTATLPSDLSEAISKVYAVAGLADFLKVYRIDYMFLIKSRGQDPRGVGFGVPPPPKVTGSSLVPVGIQILCKLSDLAGYLKYVDGMGIPFLDQTMTPADYASKYPPSMIPPGLTAKIIDKSNGAILWDPITTYVTNGTIAPFPSTTNVGTYVFYTNVGKIVPYEVPQKQSDRNAIDRILYNILDIFVTIDGTDKTSSLYGYLVNNLNISPELISASSFISSFTFQNIVYETYSTVSEDFRGSQNDSLQLDKLHYGDGTMVFPTFTVTSVLAYGSAIALFGGAVYYAMKKKMFKRFR